MKQEMETGQPQVKFIRLTVPFLKKDSFKQKYGRDFAWNPEGKYWFWRGALPVPDDLQPFVHASCQERPASSRLQLTIELVPSTCWLSKVQSHVTKAEWDTIRKETARAAGYVCKICGGKGERWPVECHELFEYDDATQTQRVLGFQALCPTCHLVKHFGMAQHKGMEEEALNQLCKVNGWTRSQARKYVDEQFDLWRKRSKLEWKIDLSCLERRGILVKPESSTQRRERGDSYYREKLAEYRQTHPAHSLWEELTTDDGAYYMNPEPSPSIPPVIPTATPAKASPSIWKRMLGFIFPNRND